MYLKKKKNSKKFDFSQFYLNLKILVGGIFRFTKFRVRIENESRSIINKDNEVAQIP